MQWASFELLGGALSMVKRTVNKKQKGTPCAVGVHGEEKHCGGGCDRKRGGHQKSEKCVAQRSGENVTFIG